MRSAVAFDLVPISFSAPWTSTSPHIEGFLRIAGALDIQDGLWKRFTRDAVKQSIGIFPERVDPGGQKLSPLQNNREKKK